MSRHCPICDRSMEELVCPADGVETIDPRAFGEASPLAPGATVAGRFRVERRLGGGGMGQVYLATQLSMARPVALKVLKNRVEPRSNDVKRFYLEAREASRLSHPNIVRIYDFGVDPGTGMPFLAMEYVDGETMRGLIQRGPISERAAAGLMAQVTRALVEAHGKGLIHRDLKPENMLLSLKDGVDHLSILDFGIAKVVRDAEIPSLTATGAIIGTPTYMSPEQVNGDTVDERSDLYSIGCILFELLTGKPPFRAHTALALMFQHVNDPAPGLPPRLPGGLAPSQRMRGLVRSLLEKPPNARPSSAAEVASVLEAICPETTRSSLLPRTPSAVSEEFADTHIRDSDDSAHFTNPRPKRILVVDDEAILRRALANMLEDSGYEVAPADSAESAIEALRTQNFSLVLTDLHMPGMGGMDLLSFVVTEWPSTPVIVVTGESSVPQAVEAMRKGAADYVMKPFDPEALLKTIAGVIGTASQ